MRNRFVIQLFPPFLRGSSGAGVLLLRLALACSLAQSLLTGSGPDGLSKAFVFLVLEILMTAMLAVGLWTPVAGMLVCLFQLFLAFATTGALGPHLLEAAMGLSIALLGPGVLSVDARLFGRRRVEIPQ